MKQRLISIAAAALMVLALTPSAFAATTTVTGGSTITANGTYQVAASATGVITINAGKTVTLQGSGTSAAANQELSIQCGKGVNLTLKDLCITNNSDLNILDFTGTGNVLKASGTNVLESIAYTPKAAIHVGPDADLSFQNGGGVLYLYKRTQGSGIGSDAEEANGAITFDGGTWFVKGTKTGAVIGNDTCGDAEKEAQIGDITINGGELYVEANARGAAIGGSNESRAGKVVVNGGTIGIWVDWTGSAIGAGASMRSDGQANGVLSVNGGSIKVHVDDNCVLDWGIKEAQEWDSPITAQKVNSSNQAVARYVLDLSEYTANTSGDAYVVKVDEKEFYRGGLHEYEYTANTESTVGNWTKKASDKSLYLYLTEGTHTLSVNNSASTSITVVEPDYSGSEVSVPSESWLKHVDENWYHSGDTFTISTNQQLAGLASIVNAGTDSFSGKTITLTESVNLSAYAWDPIGTEEHPFQGTFDGDRNTVSWLLIDQKNDGNLGFFGCVDGAEIYDLTVENGYAAGYYNVGAVVGKSMNSSLTNCIGNVELFAQYTGSTGGGTNGDYVGGIIGCAENCQMAKCENYGYLSGNRCVGGVVGGFSGTMTDCVNYGECRTGNEYCAGIVGQQLGVMSLNDCVNNAPINGLVASGIVGNSKYGMSATIISCINNGNVNCGNQGGGILTRIPENTEGIQIQYCENNGELQTLKGVGEGIGGIVGIARGGSILSCRNNGNVIGGAATTNAYGGIVGAIYNGTVTIADCYNSGYISSTRKTDRIGGIIGKLFFDMPTNATVAQYQKQYQSYISSWSNNLYVSGTASGGLGSWDQFSKTSSNYESIQMPLDISGKVEVDPDTITASEVVIGDLSGDGKVNSKDVTLLRRTIVSTSGTFSEVLLKVADMNQDGKLNSKDVTLLRRYIVSR